MKNNSFWTIVLSSAVAVACTKENAQVLTLNEQEYFEERGVNVLVYSNNPNGGFNDEKNTGIELIHHGVRTLQGGTVRLSRTPEQWDLMPDMTSRKVSKQDNSIEVGLEYKEYAFKSRITVTAKGQDVEVSVWLDEPLPESVVGKAGFNLEILPSQYWSKTYVVDGKEGRFPRYAASATETRPNEEKPLQYKGFKTYDDRGTGRFVDPLPIVQGRDIVMAPECPERMVHISSDQDIALYDGRMIAQNGWYVLRSELPAGKTGKVLTWTLSPNSVKDWLREPNVGFSQVGYVPQQPKVAVIELDANDTRRPKGELWRIMPDGSQKCVLTAQTTEWGRYFKYDYVHFDFSKMQDSGIYYIKYGDTCTENFIIGDDVYDHIADATSDVWVPVHMNHMAVNEGYRMWHGEPFKEGYYQAPESDHFDYHFQGPIVDSPYKAHQLIPGLNVGGFFDAGDFDMETGSIATVVQNLVRNWDMSHDQRDQTFVSKEQRYVDLHRPDGTPDLLQYIEHGVVNIVAQVERLGYAATALSNSVLDNYHHLGDAASITDGIAGNGDDMWAFTTRNPILDMRAVTTMAAAARVLKGYNDDLADRALKQAERLMAVARPMAEGFKTDVPLSGQHDELSVNGYPDIPASIQLYAATGKEEYRDIFVNRIWKALDEKLPMALQPALDAIPFLDEAYVQKLRPYVEKYATYMKTLDKDNPYGVPIDLGSWAGSVAIADYGTACCFANRYYPDIVGPDMVYGAASWLFGCHPYHNYSLVATLGANRPKQLFYGNNRADFAAIPGNVAPGLLMHYPDHFENMDDWPFFWAENEGTIVGNTAYMIFAKALQGSLRKE